MARHTLNLTLMLDGKAVATQGLAGVMFGRILLCGGQSNMQFDLHSSFNGSAEVSCLAANRFADSPLLCTTLHRRANRGCY